MADPILSAKRSTYDEFMGDYDPATTPTYRSPSTGQTVLFGALANRDLATRVALANRLLDDGADAAATTSSGVTLPHVLLSQRQHDPVPEAALLQRLLDGGADVNKPERRDGAPLAILYNAFISDEDSVPYYDVLFARPDLDLDAPATSKLTVRELIMDVASRKRPLLQERVRRHDSAGGDDD